MKLLARLYFWLVALEIDWGWVFLFIAYGIIFFILYKSYQDEVQNLQKWRLYFEI